MKVKHAATMLILLIAALAMVFTIYVMSGEEIIEQPSTYTVDEVIEVKDLVPEESAPIPVKEESEKQVELMNEVKIEIKDLRFYPAEVTVSPGTKVTWINNDHSAHKVVAYDRLFYGPRMAPGEEYSFTFSKEGTHRYFDAVFTRVGKGTVIVKEEPLPITGAAIGASGNADSLFGLFVTLFVIMIFALSHGMHLHYKK